MTPSVSWSLQELLLLIPDNREPIIKLAIGQDVETAADLLLCVLVTDLSERHLVETVLFSETLLSGLDLNLLAHLISLLFVFVADILIDQPLLIFNLHVDWIVHQAITTI